MQEKRRWQERLKRVMESPRTSALVWLTSTGLSTANGGWWGVNKSWKKPCRKQHSVSYRRTEDESVCFEPGGRTSSRPGFYNLNFLKALLWVWKWLGLWRQYQRIPHQGVSEGFWLIPTGLWMRSLFWWRSWKCRRLLPCARSSAIHSLACWAPHKAQPCGFSEWQEPPGTTCSDVGLTVVDDD